MNFFETAKPIPGDLRNRLIGENSNSQLNPMSHQPLTFGGCWILTMDYLISKILSAAHTSTTAKTQKLKQFSSSTIILPHKKDLSSNKR